MKLLHKYSFIETDWMGWINVVVAPLQPQHTKEDLNTSQCTVFTVCRM